VATFPSFSSPPPQAPAAGAAASSFSFDVTEADFRQTVLEEAGSGNGLNGKANRLIESIVARFVSSAMSLGALSPEAHEALAEIEARRSDGLKSSCLKSNDR
jgi:glutamate synthase domain-containing protein 2